MEVGLGKGGVRVGGEDGQVGPVGIEPKEEGQEEARDDNVPQSQQAHLQLASGGVRDQGAGEQDLDGTVQVLGHGDHDVGPEHPEDVVEEEPHQEDGPDLVGSQAEPLDALEAERYAQDVVEGPVLGLEVETREDQRGQEGQNAGGGGVDAQVPGGLAEDGPGEGMAEVDLPGDLRSREGTRQDGLEDGRSRRREGGAPHHAEVSPYEEVDRGRIEVLEGHVKAEQAGRTQQGELHGVLLPHGLGSGRTGGVGIVGSARGKLPPGQGLLLPQDEGGVARHVEDGRDQDEEVGHVGDGDELRAAPEAYDEGCRKDYEGVLGRHRSGEIRLGG